MQKSSPPQTPQLDSNSNYMKEVASNDISKRSLHAFPSASTLVQHNDSHHGTISSFDAFKRKQIQDQAYYIPPPIQPQGQQINGLLPSEADRNYNGLGVHPLKKFLLGPLCPPYFSYLSAICMTAALIYEFVQHHKLTGSVISTSPFNPMIGPSFQVLVNTGARFTPCIRPVPSLPISSLIGNCYRNETSTCTIEELCGFSEYSNGTLDQAFRFVLPIFLHSGIIHFLVNMLTHLRLGVDLERLLGTPRYILLYISSGIYGFILSAMLSQNLTASTGCSGALFGLIGYMFVDVLVNWKVLSRPVRELMSLLMSTIIILVLGLLPGLDNFAHIGGFVVGILLGMVISPMRPKATRNVKIVTWILKAMASALLVVLFVISILKFYSAEDPSKICVNCKYLSCLPVSNWCDL